MLDSGSGFLLSIKQSISYIILQKREHTWKPCLTFYHYHQIINILYHIPEKGTYLEAMFDRGSDFLLSIKQSISYIILQKRGHTWKPCLIAVPAFYLSIAIKQPISYIILQKREDTWKPCLTFYHYHQIINILSFKGKKSRDVPGNLTWLRFRLSIIN